MNTVFIKQHWIGLFAIEGFFLLFFITNPFGCILPPKPKIDTVTNTVYVQQPPVQIPVYIPTPSSSQAPIIIPPSYQPAQDQTALLKQYQELVNKFLTTNTYKETTPLKDSAGNDVGHFDTKQTVSENQIKTNDFSYQLKFPHTTTTITITKPYQPRFKVL